MIDILWYSIGLVAAFLTMLGFVPQIIKMLKTKFVRDISFTMMLQTSIGASLWILYGIHINDPIVIVANVVSLATLIIAILLYINYRSNSESQVYFHKRGKELYEDRRSRLNGFISKICHYVNNRGFYK